MRSKDRCDRTGSSAQVDGGSVGGQPLHRPARQRFAEPSRDVDVGIDVHRDVTEGDGPGDPGEWLAGQPASDERVEEMAISGRASDELLRLLFGGDEPGAREPSRELSKGS